MTKIKTKPAGISKITRTTVDLKSQPINNRYDLVVFCHLRWKFVYQRP